MDKIIFMYNLALIVKYARYVYIIGNSYIFTLQRNIMILMTVYVNMKGFDI